MKKFQILIIRNNTDLGNTQKLKERFSKTGLVPFIDERNSDLQDLEIHKFYPAKDLYGLKGIKERLRPHVEKNTFHVVMFLYRPQEGWENIAAWALQNPLHKDTASKEVFIEVPVKEEWGEWNNDAMWHEMIHAFHRRVWWAGKVTKDTMDSYSEVLGGEEENLSALEPHWGVIGRITPVVGLMKLLIPLLNLVRSLTEKIQQAVLEPPATKKSRIKDWANAIKTFEGWFPGSRSQRNNNPGNLKYAGQAGAHDKDDGGFAVFTSYSFGWNALIRQLTIAADGTSNVYNPEMTLLEFFQVYAPAEDNNEPRSYALFVAQKVGVDVTTKIKELL